MRFATEHPRQVVEAPSALAAVQLEASSPPHAQIGEVKHPDAASAHGTSLSQQHAARDAGSRCAGGPTSDDDPAPGSCEAVPAEVSGEGTYYDADEREWSP